MKIIFKKRFLQGTKVDQQAWWLENYKLNEDKNESRPKLQINLNEDKKMVHPV